MFGAAIGIDSVKVNDLSKDDGVNQVKHLRYGRQTHCKKQQAFERLKVLPDYFH
jgi:hypothetical protein